MKKFAIILLAVSLVASMALAEKPKDNPWTPITYVGDGTAKVGGEDFGSATVIPALPYTDSGSTAGTIHDYDVHGNTAGDVVYSYTPAADVYIDADLCDSTYDTRIAILIDDGDPPTEVAYNDDSCGLQSAVTQVGLTGGVTYYIVVTGYSASEGDYVLNVVEGTPPPPPPANDLCEDAEILPLGDYSIDGDTSLANADYSPTISGCTRYSQALGKDVVYATCLADGDMFDVVMTSGYDASIYLVADCADIDGSCVAGGDDPESFSYQNTSGADQQLYLIVDAYSSGEGEFNISGYNGSNCETVATEKTSFGSLKGMYR